MLKCEIQNVYKRFVDDVITVCSVYEVDSKEVYDSISYYLLSNSMLKILLSFKDKESAHTILRDLQKYALTKYKKSLSDAFNICQTEWGIDSNGFQVLSYYCEISDFKEKQVLTSNMRQALNELPKGKSLFPINTQPGKVGYVLIDSSELIKVSQEELTQINKELKHFLCHTDIFDKLEVQYILSIIPNNNYITLDTIKNSSEMRALTTYLYRVLTSNNNLGIKCADNSYWFFVKYN